MNERPEDLVAAIALLDRMLADREAGALRTRGAYESEFPDQHAAVARAWEQLEGGAVPDAPPMPPRRIGAYRLERELGRGAQGTVWLANDERLGRPVALKILAGAWAAAPEALRRFDHEARTLASLDHPGFCSVYEAFTHDGLSCIAFRYVPGETLAEQLRRQASAVPGPAAIAAVLVIIERVARAVHAAHEAGVVHRDLKPGNIMVGTDGQPTILDFGLARSMATDGAGLTATGDLLGTPAYMAPEQAAGDVHAIDRRTDVHALGVMLFETVTGSRPFQGTSATAVLEAVRSSEAPDARRINPRVSADLRTVVGTALAKSPADRYATALEFADDVRRVRLFEPIAARPIGMLGRVLRWSRRRPAMAALVAVLGLTLPALTALGTWFITTLPQVREQEATKRKEHAERLMERGTSHLAAGRARKAAADFRAVFALQPDSREAAAGVALCLLKDGKPREALESLDAFCAGRPASPGLQALRLRLLERLGEGPPVPEADPSAPLDDVECFVEALRHKADGDDGVAGAYEKACRFLEAAIQRAPVRRLVYLKSLAHAASRTHREDTASIIAGSVRIKPGGAAGELLAGLALVTVDPTKATAALTRARELGVDIVDVGYGMAMTLAEHGRHAEAVAAFRNLLPSRPDDATLHFNISALEVKLGRFTEALEAAQQAVALRPDIADYQGHLGKILRDGHSRGADAVKAYEKAAAADGTGTRWKAELAATLAVVKRSKEALLLAEQVLAADPASFVALRAKARAARDLDDVALALDSIRKARDLKPGSGAAALDHVRYLVAAGRTADARRLFDATLAQPPSDIPDRMLALTESELLEAEKR